VRRRALLASTAVVAAAPAGCLADARRAAWGDVRHDHSRLTVHDAGDEFVRGGLGPDPDARFRAWLFAAPPPADESVFTDALGADDRREWDNEVHNESYDEGFLLLAQSSSPRSSPRGIEPAFPTDPAWSGWRRAAVPFEVGRIDVPADRYPDADRLTTTFLGYYAASTSPRRATAVIRERTDGARAGPVRARVAADRWSPP
jgi:hypothetical protein